MGVAREFDVTHKPYIFFEMAKPLTVDGKEIRKLGVTIHNFDPKASPKGKTVLTVLVESHDPKYWIKLREQDKEGYERKKEAIANHVVNELEGRFGEIKNNIEIIDVATPATFARYTNNWNGALMGWTDPNLILHKPKKKIRGLRNFYMCGQWTGDVGLPGAAISGRLLARMICKKDSKEFRAM
jgi:phytoene dehydrogenase-like protein